MPWRPGRSRWSSRLFHHDPVGSVHLAHATWSSNSALHQGTEYSLSAASPWAMSSPPRRTMLQPYHRIRDLSERHPSLNGQPMPWRTCDTRYVHDFRRILIARSATPRALVSELPYADGRSAWE